jgi:hypothetical protein
LAKVFKKNNNLYCNKIERITVDIKIEKNILKNVVHLLSILLIIFSTTPYLRRNISLYVSAILVVIWVIVAGLSAIKKRITIPKYFIYSNIYIGLILCYLFIGLSTAALGNYFNLLMFFFFSWVYYYYIKNIDHKKQVQLINIGVILSIINVISNIYLLYIFPNASVELNYSKIFFNTNVGGTTFSFYCLILLIFFLVIRDNLKSNRLKLLNALIIIASIIYILQAARAISVFLMLFSISLFFYTKLTVNKIRSERVLYTTFFIILSFILLLNLNNILIILANHIGNERLELRINTIIWALSSGRSEEGISISILTRVDLYKLSITTFFSSIKNFLFGVGYHTSENMSTSWLFNVGIGNHSELLDTAGRYGLIGILPLGMFFYRFMKYIKKNIHRKDFQKLKLIGFIFFIYSILNNSLDPSVGVLILLIIPLYFTNKNIAVKELMRKAEATNATE